MNDTSASAPGASLIPETTDLFTGGAFVLIAILAALAIAAIIFGMRLSARRRQGEREVAEHNAEIRDRSQPEPTRVASEDHVGLAPPAPPAPVREPDPVAAEAPAPEPRPLVQELAPATSPPAPAALSGGPAPADGPVTQLKGLGPKVAQRLAEHGITTVGQLAALTDDEAASLDAHMGPFTGRMGRDRWQEQARFLAAGDRAGFEAVFGRL